MEIISRVECGPREQKEVQLEGVTLVDEEIIEISEEAYKKNYVYRPWIEEEISQDKQSELEAMQG